jgi:hypothetical protein
MLQELIVLEHPLVCRGPIAIAPTPAKNVPKRSSFFSVELAANNQSNELFSSAMKPSMLVAV